ncbi:Response regulator receiver domain-containing protein [Pedobacter terrae]|uniref:Response regulator receiver domain-containing protein n=1 Tax=Pedobacter terrae TaxID=405671 RepID=A0A1G8B0X6_9SPHI|nr:response regulator transcription factor [Pedobacter terrae]SDH26847.1 Response regulator receiver domain-containing protein [Pedobacter terrae]
MIRLMLAEDNDIVREGLSQMLAAQVGITIAAEAENGDSALEKLQAGIAVDVMLVDWNMPGISGVELTRRIKRLMPHIKVIILTMHSKDEYRVQAFNAGASAYVLKDLEVEDLAKIIREVYTIG